jgi:hypothetical protein
MSRNALISAVVLGLVLTALFWIDPLFIPLALVGPPITGAIAALRRMPLTWIATAWFVAGVGAIVSDYVVNREDVIFHIVLTGFVVGLAAGAWSVARKLAGGAPAPAR